MTKIASVWDEKIDLPDFKARKLVRWALIGVGMLGVCQIIELAYILQRFR
jgi:hypothetical protein